MFLIVGLGNIGTKYQHTRHNIGFDAVDLISSKYNIPINREKFKGTYGEGTISDNKVMLLKPSTYMNLSGESVIEAANFFKIKSSNIIIIYDDIDLEVGRIRIRKHGSAGGHNGIKSVIANLGTDVFPRIKIGIGQPKGDLVSHVLGKFDKNERNDIEKVLETSADVLECLINCGVEEAMNKFNGLKISSDS
ncbi:MULTISPECIES: aminoacyl-tRNA hydrolase [Clostridium]|uniref:Peptidyl-tRNA hydrolase n=1 Tax=Clostridium ragsdalei P11 TaxID=1353534 RepID=A0A1A6B254_9CLOT|nr:MULTISPECIES: aminoacyl-tRNA hydrolase [Clostridium]OBR96365.1 peptidyl-tRNA hydrolase [Clostridium ragsdalei P11]QXE19169.1 aminoacyl-tRNA hydrolase [Clostridium sp. 001]